MNRTRIVLLSLLLVLGVVASAPTTWAADDQPPAWHVTVIPYLWATGISGDVTVRGRTTSPDASFIDILDNTDSLIGLQGHVAITRGPLGGYLDLTYIKLGVDGPDPTNLELINKMFLVEFGAQYRLLDTMDAEGHGIVLEAYAGGRYTSIKLELDSQAGKASQSQSWIDPVVGGRVTFGLSEHFVIVVGGDVGGFGVGSDFAWSALGLLGYRWHAAGVEWTLLAGYKALFQDYSTGSGVQRFKWDTTMHGPIMGLSMQF